MLSTMQKLQEHWWPLTDDEGREIPLNQIDQKNIFGESPIHIAAWKGDAEDIEWLVKNGADLNDRGEFQMTPLHYAYMGKNRKNIEELINLGADQSARCDRGLMPHERLMQTK
jgi:uncharacterized protein